MDESIAGAAGGGRGKQQQAGAPGARGGGKGPICDASWTEDGMGVDRVDGTRIQGPRDSV